MESFGTRGESFGDIRRAYPQENLQGKHVFSVLGHGYPPFFFAEGAKSVVSFDVSHEAVAWSLLVRQAITLFDFEKASEFFTHEPSDKSAVKSPLLVDVLSTLDISERHKQVASKLYDDYSRVKQRDRFTDKSAANDRFYDNEERYNTTRGPVSEGLWRITKSEVLPALLDTTEMPPIDFAYLSNILSWMALKHENLSYETKRLKQDEMTHHRAKLAQALDSLLAEDGTIYELVLSPRIPPLMQDVDGWKGETSFMNPSSGGPLYGSQQWATSRYMRTGRP